MATINVVTNEIERRKPESRDNKKKVLPAESSKVSQITHQSSASGTAMLSDLEDIRNKERKAKAEMASASVRRASELYAEHERKAKAQQAISGSPDEEVHEQITRFRKELAEVEGSYLINPDSPWVQKWDIVIILCLIFTGFVTPYEVAVLDAEPSVFCKFNVSMSLLFVANRVVDLAFMVDMTFMFFMAYRANDVRHDGLYVKDFGLIRAKYLKGWFTIDFISILPFWLLNLPLGSGACQDIEKGAVGKMQLVRFVRVLRLTKLARAFKASRIYKRWESDINISYSTLGLLKFITILLVMGHWLACAWLIVEQLAPSGSLTWLFVLRQSWGFGKDNAVCDPASLLLFKYGEDWDGMPVPVDACPDPAPSEAYAAAVYWALVTITSVGYGDITPKNPTEAWWCTVLLLIGSCLWAYIIGNVCGIVSTLDVETSRHQQTMDRLNAFMDDRLMPSELQHELRLYFNMRKDINKSESYKELLDVMSPDLKAKVTLLHSSWLFDVPVLSGCSERFVVAVSDLFASGVFIPHETIPWSNCLCAVSRGVATWNGRVHTAGMHWGDDFVLHSLKLKLMEPVHALTYVELLTLTSTRLYCLLETFPLDAKVVRKFLVRMTVKRGVLYYAKKLGATTRSAKVGDRWARRWKSDIDHREEQVKTELSSKASLQSALAMPNASSKSRNIFSRPVEEARGDQAEELSKAMESQMEKQLKALQLIMGNSDAVRRMSSGSPGTPMRAGVKSVAKVAADFKTKTFKNPNNGSQVDVRPERLLCDAAKRGDTALIISILREAGGVAAAEQKDAEGRTPLILAIQNGHDAAVVALLGAPHNAPRDYQALEDLARTNSYETTAGIVASFALRQDVGTPEVVETTEVVEIRSNGG